jgi:uncharacterized protein (DUF2141 family)
MKTLLITALLTTSLMANTLHITLSSLKHSSGKIHIGLFDTSKSYTQNTKPYQGVILTIKNKKLTHSFENLPKGMYAVAIFHDENANGVLDKNMLGIPTEGYGFSNNTKAVFSAPSFEESQFSLDKSTKITIKMDY